MNGTESKKPTKKCLIMIKGGTACAKNNDEKRNWIIHKGHRSHIKEVQAITDCLERENWKQLVVGWNCCAPSLRVSEC